MRHWLLALSSLLVRSCSIAAPAYAGAVDLSAFDPQPVTATAVDLSAFEAAPLDLSAFSAPVQVDLSAFDATSATVIVPRHVTVYYTENCAPCERMKRDVGRGDNSVQVEFQHRSKAPISLGAYPAIHIKDADHWEYGYRDLNGLHSLLSQYLPPAGVARPANDNRRVLSSTPESKQGAMPNTTPSQPVLYYYETTPQRRGLFDLLKGSR